MAAEFTNVAAQTIADNYPVVFSETAIRCRKGYVLHREGSGIVTLRGIVNCPNACNAMYEVSFGANVALPTGATVEPITIGLAISGEVLPASTAIVTPAAAGDFFNVYVSANIFVAKGCCTDISVENVSGQAITVQNANIKINRIA